MPICVRISLFHRLLLLSAPCLFTLLALVFNLMVLSCSFRPRIQIVAAHLARHVTVPIQCCSPSRSVPLLCCLTCLLVPPLVVVIISTDSLCQIGLQMRQKPTHRALRVRSSNSRLGHDHSSTIPVVRYRASHNNSSSCTHRSLQCYRHILAWMDLVVRIISRLRRCRFSGRFSINQRAMPQGGSGGRLSHRRRRCR